MRPAIPFLMCPGVKWVVVVFLLLLSISFSDSAAQYEYDAHFFLEIWGTAPSDSIPASLQDCQVDWIDPLHLWTHNSYEFVWVAVRLGSVEDGYSEVQFGLWNECSPEDMRFLYFRPCPGFMQLLTSPGPPASCFVWLPSGCNQWMDYVGYFLFMARPGASCRFVVVPNAYTEEIRVKACGDRYYSVVGTSCCAQYSATQTVTPPWDEPVCGGCDVTDVKDTTWGRIKTLYR